VPIAVKVGSGAPPAIPTDRPRIAPVHPPATAATRNGLHSRPAIDGWKVVDKRTYNPRELRGNGVSRTITLED
jgi:hypothetical protein